MNRFSLILLTACAATGAVAAAFAAGNPPGRTNLPDSVAAAAASAPTETPAAVPAVTSVAAAGTSPAAAAVREIELPADTGTYRQGAGVELAQAFCLNCHSVEYCETQPLSAEKYWAATVKKMKEKFGAPLPDEVMAPLAKYLTEAYGKAAP